MPLLHVPQYENEMITLARIKQSVEQNTIARAYYTTTETAEEEDNDILCIKLQQKLDSIPSQYVMHKGRSVTLQFSTAICFVLPGVLRSLSIL